MNIVSRTKATSTIFMKLPWSERANWWLAILLALSACAGWLRVAHLSFPSQAASCGVAALLALYHAFSLAKEVRPFFESIETNRTLDEAPRFPSWVPAELGPIEAALHYVTHWRANRRQEEIAPLVVVGRKIQGGQRFNDGEWARCRTTLPRRSLWPLRMLVVDGLPLVLYETLRIMHYAQGTLVAVLMLAALMAMLLHLRQYRSIYGVKSTKLDYQLTIISPRSGELVETVFQIGDNAALLVMFGKETLFLVVPEHGSSVCFRTPPHTPPPWLTNLEYRRWCLE